jgi:hypothetical protein
MVWGFVKNKLRRHCNYSYSDLERNFPVFLDEVLLKKQLVIAIDL